MLGFARTPTAPPLIEHRAVSGSSDDAYLVLTDAGTDVAAAFYASITRVVITTQAPDGTLTNHDTTGGATYITPNPTDARLDIEWGQSPLTPGTYRARVRIYGPDETNGEHYLDYPDYRVVILPPPPA